MNRLVANAWISITLAVYNNLLLTEFKMRDPPTETDVIDALESDDGKIPHQCIVSHHPQP